MEIEVVVLRNSERFRQWSTARPLRRRVSPRVGRSLADSLLKRVGCVFSGGPLPSFCTSTYALPVLFLQSRTSCLAPGRGQGGDTAVAGRTVLGTGAIASSLAPASTACCSLGRVCTHTPSQESPSPCASLSQPLCLEHEVVQISFPNKEKLLDGSSVAEFYDFSWRPWETLRFCFFFGWLKEAPAIQPRLALNLL